jgi:hypothetical protein
MSRQEPRGAQPVRSPNCYRLVITGVDTVLTGSVTSYTVTATLSDGTTRTVTPVWTSSDPGVGSVDSTGRLDGRAHGSTNLTASYLGRDTSKMVHVVNNYTGTWNGQYIISTCDDSGDLKDHDGGWCRGRVRVGTVWYIRLVLSQTASNLSEISGTLGLADVNVGDKITGVVTADGRLSLTGTLHIHDFYGEFLLGTVQIQTWDTNLSGPAGDDGSLVTKLFLHVFPDRQCNYGKRARHNDPNGQRCSLNRKASLTVS